MPLHILMLSTEYRLHRVGGLGAHVRALAPRIGEQAKIDLVAPRYETGWPDTEPLGRYGQVRRVDADKPQAAWDFDLQVWRMNDQLNRAISAWIDGGQVYSLLHTHDWLTGYAANDLHRRYGLPMVVTFHATEYGRVSGNIYASELSQRIHLAERHLAHEADLIITCSRYMRDEVLRVLEAPEEKITVIPNGVETAEYMHLRSGTGRQNGARKRWASPDGPLLFFVGRLVHEKGPDLLVSAMDEVRRVYPTAQAVIAGDGPLREQLQQQIEHLDLGRNVQLAGYVDDETRNQLYAGADLAVFPSRYEPFGIVALEAMATGIPVVVASVGGLKEVVENDVTGLCVQPGYADSLAAAILRSLGDPGQAGERAHRARELALEQYDWSSIAVTTLQAYRMLAPARNPSLV